MINIIFNYRIKKRKNFLLNLISKKEIENKSIIKYLLVETKTFDRIIILKDANYELIIKNVGNYIDLLLDLLVNKKDIKEEHIKIISENVLFNNNYIYLFNKRISTIDLYKIVIYRINYNLSLLSKHIKITYKDYDNINKNNIENNSCFIILREFVKTIIFNTKIDDLVKYMFNKNDYNYSEELIKFWNVLATNTVL